MLTFLREQRDETVKLILNLQKKLKVKNKYEAAMKNNSRFVSEINHVRNQTNQQKKLLILKRTRSMQLQQQLNALKISNIEIDKIRRLQKNEVEKSRFLSVSADTRREIFFFSFSPLQTSPSFMTRSSSLSTTSLKKRSSASSLFSTSSSTNLTASSSSSIGC